MVRSSPLSRTALLLFLVFAISPSTGRAQVAQEPPGAISLRDYTALVSVESVLTSPDGARTLYQRTHADLEADGWVDEIWEIAADGTERRLLANATQPAFSPDGRRLAVLREGQLWIVPLRGGEPWQATRMREPITEMSWSPDGSTVVVVSREPRSAPPALDGAQRRSSKAVSTDPVAGDLVPGAWIPAEGDARPSVAPEAVTSEEPAVLAPLPPVEQQDPPRTEGATEGAPDAPLPPRVIRRLQFKADGEGYLPPRYSHLYRVEISASAQAPVEPRRLTAGAWNDRAPAWSPDGRWIAYVSSRGPEPDLSGNAELWLVDEEGTQFRLTDSPGPESAPAWSPDGRWLAFRYTPVDPPIYSFARLQMIGLYGPESDDAPPTLTAELSPTDPIELTAELDRPIVSAPRWHSSATELYVTVEDRGTVPLVRVGTGLTPLGGRPSGLLRRRPRADPEDRGRVRAIVSGPRVVGSFDLRAASGSDDEPSLVFVMAAGTAPPEIYETSSGTAGTEVPMLVASAHLNPTPSPVAAALRRLTSVNEPLRSSRMLSEPEPIRFESDEGVFVEGWLLRPAELPEASGLPLVVSLHGGPVAQYTWAFDFYHQWLAAQGYAVLFVNPRGSSGAGLEFAHALWADWGGPDLRDVIAGIDHLRNRGVIDPARIGVGGWSYGGILTNYLITRTDRFAAAVSGASETDNFAAYGVDDLQQWWEQELGLPYEPEARARYDRLSAIHDVARISTPTLFMVGEKDVRVPAAQSEQMYQQLRRRMVDGGPETALVVYPGEFHVPQRPSFDLDFFLRTKAWYDRHVLGDPDADPYFGERAW